MFNISCVMSLLFMIVPVREPTVCACFHIKLFLWKCFSEFFSESVAFARITTCTEQELSFRIIVTYSRYVMRKAKFKFCGYYILLFIFLQRRSHRACQRIIQGKSKSIPNSNDAEKCTSSKSHRGENVYRLSQQITKPNYKSTLLAFECVFHKFCCFNYLVIVIVVLNPCLNPK